MNKRGKTSFRKRFLKSFQTRTFLLILVIGMICITAALEMLGFSARNAVIQQKLSELEFTCNIAIGEMQGENVSEALTESMVRELGWVAEYSGGRILVIDEFYRVAYDSFNALTGRYCVSEEVTQTFYGVDYSEYLPSTQYVELTLPISTKRSLSEEDRAINGVLIASAGASWTAEVIRTITRQTRTLEAAGFLILAAIAFITAGTLVGPWNTLKRTLQKIIGGDLNVRFEMEGGYTETGDIIDTFNRILERLRLLDESRQEFVSNVSHELKTPITSMRVLADSLINDPNTPVDLYREFMTDISEEIDRETKIINDLLSLVKLDKSSTDLNISQVNVNRLVEQILSRVRPIAKLRSIEIIYESFRTITAEIDETKFGLALTNLVENGVKYNNDGGWVRVSLNADHRYFFVRVADSGVGIPEDEREKIFERFYRVDKARSRETGGTGLGLAITKSVIQLHGGEIHVEGGEGSGAVFEVRMPLKHTEGEEQS